MPPGGSPTGRTSTLATLRAVISAVPRGKVITYGQVAAAAGFPGAARQTVRALQGAEGLPWHRVVGAGGRIALSGEDGREQRLRLEIEGITFRGGRVRMDLHSWSPTARSRDLASGRAVRRPHPLRARSPEERGGREPDPSESRRAMSAQYR